MLINSSIIKQLRSPSNQYNLGIFARPSSSMLNTDQTATTFWITNTNNIIRHNHAAGGANFGFWINPPANHHHGACDWFIQEGYTRCPRNRKVGEFRNNTAHSMGEYGFWIFEEYVPTLTGKSLFKSYWTIITYMYTPYSHFCEYPGPTT